MSGTGMINVIFDNIFYDPLENFKKIKKIIAPFFFKALSYYMKTSRLYKYFMKMGCKLIMSKKNRLKDLGEK
jgi:hypothetical protein